MFLVALVTGHAQTVNFNNNILTSPPDRLVRFGGTLAPVVGQNYTAVLLYGTSDSSLTAHTSTALFRVPTTASPGTWSGGTRTLTGVPNTPGSVVRLQVAVFDNSQYPNFDIARAAGAAWARPPFDYTIPSQPPTPGADSMVNFIGGVLEPLPPIPEPSVAGLLAIGVVALMVNRQRRA